MTYLLVVDIHLVPAPLGVGGINEVRELEIGVLLVTDGLRDCFNARGLGARAFRAFHKRIVVVVGLLSSERFGEFSGFPLATATAGLRYKRSVSYSRF
jgi:hypothetical protein